MNSVYISIITPFYNSEAHLTRFIDSIKKQTKKEFEIICVDDGSTDMTGCLLDEIASKDKRFRVVHQTNKGASAARNVGIQMAKGDYLYIIDSDDWLPNDSLEIIAKNAAETDADLIYGDFYISCKEIVKLTKVFDHSFFTKEKDFIQVLYAALNSAGFGINTKFKKIGVINDFGGAPWRAAIKKSIIVDNDIRYDESLKGLGEDILFTQNVYEFISSVSYVACPIYYYVIHKESLSHGYKNNIINEYINILNKEKEYLSGHKKSDYFWKFYYYRVAQYINLSMDSFFMNEMNTMSKKDRYILFKKIIQLEPFRTPLKLIPISMTVGIKTKILFLLLKMGHFRLYWIIKDIYNRKI